MVVSILVFNFTLISLRSNRQAVSDYSLGFTITNGEDYCFCHYSYY